MRGARGQQIGEYAVLIGIVATASISTQLYVSRRVAGRLVTASHQMLGTAAPVEQGSNESDAFSWVRERGGPGAVPTMSGAVAGIHTETGSTATGSSSAGFLLAEAYGPKIGEVLALDGPTAEEQITAALGKFDPEEGDEFTDLKAIDDNTVEGTITRPGGKKNRVRFSLLGEVTGSEDQSLLLVRIDTNENGAFDDSDRYFVEVLTDLASWGQLVVMLDSRISVTQEWTDAMRSVIALDEYEVEELPIDVETRNKLIKLVRARDAGGRVLQTYRRVVGSTGPLEHLDQEELEALDRQTSGDFATLAEGVETLSEMQQQERRQAGEERKAALIVPLEEGRDRAPELLDSITRTNKQIAEGGPVVPHYLELYELRILFQEPAEHVRDFVRLVEKPEEELADLLMQREPALIRVLRDVGVFYKDLLTSGPSEDEKQDRLEAAWEQRLNRPKTKAEALAIARELGGLLSKEDADEILARVDTLLDDIGRRVPPPLPNPGGPSPFPAGERPESERQVMRAVGDANGIIALLEPALNLFYGFAKDERATEDTTDQFTMLARLIALNNRRAEPIRPDPGQLVDLDATGGAIGIPDAVLTSDGRLQGYTLFEVDPKTFRQLTGLVGSPALGVVELDQETIDELGGLSALGPLPSRPSLAVTRIKDDGITRSEMMAAHLHPDDFRGFGNWLWRRGTPGAVDPNEPPLFRPDGGTNLFDPTRVGDGVTRALPDPTDPPAAPTNPRTTP